MQQLLEVEDLNVWFDLPNGGTLLAVQGVSFSVPAGSRLGMVGESGCGKTTTILALMGLLPPTASVSGRVLLDGVDVLEGGERFQVDTIDRDAEVTEMASVPEVEAGGTLPASVSRRISNQIELAAFQHEVVFEH